MMRASVFRRYPLLLLAALVAMAAFFVHDAPPPAQAQTVITLVSNTANTPQGTYGANGHVNAQAFTTGNDAKGYVVSALEMVFDSTPDATQRGTIRAELWSAKSSGVPDVRLAELTVPSSILADGTPASFTAPSGTTLDPGTTYFLVVYTTGTYDLRMDRATDKSQTGETGWTVADDRYHQSFQTPSDIDPWNQATDAVMMIAVKGYVRTSSANLSALTASRSTSASGTYSALTLSPSFATGTTAYTATAPNRFTHAKLTPTAADAQARVAVRKGATGSFRSVTSGAIALDVGENVITVRVTARGATTRDYTVTVTRTATDAFWLSTLTVQTLSAATTGCDNGQTIAARKCETEATLTDDDFSYGGKNYQVHGIRFGDTASTEFVFYLANNDPNDLDGLTLQVGARNFAFSDATIDAGAKSATWTITGFTRDVGKKLTVSLVERVVEVQRTYEIVEGTLGACENDIASVKIRVSPRIPYDTGA